MATESQLKNATGQGYERGREGKREGEREVYGK